MHMTEHFTGSDTGQLNFFHWTFVYVNGVLRWIQEHFTYTTIASIIMMGENSKGLTVNRNNEGQAGSLNRKAFCFCQTPNIELASCIVSVQRMGHPCDNGLWCDEYAQMNPNILQTPLWSSGEVLLWMRSRLCEEYSAERAKMLNNLRWLAGGESGVSCYITLSGLGGL